MKHPQLTTPARPAKLRAMQGNGTMQEGSGWRAARAGVMLMAGGIALGGCVSVSAPERPIVIELNINIKQEVVYKLDRGVGDLIENNSGVF
jgi:hypothetical protein